MGVIAVPKRRGRIADDLTIRLGEELIGRRRRHALVHVEPLPAPKVGVDFRYPAGEGVQVRIVRQREARVEGLGQGGVFVDVPPLEAR